MNPQMRTHMWVSLFVLVVFLAGFGAGIVVAPWLGFDAPPRFGPARGGPLVPPMGGRMLERIAPRIDLSADQRERLSALFAARRERFRDLDREMFRQMRARFEDEQETLRAAIAEILTPAQMERFEAEIARMGEERRRRGSERRERRERGWPGPPDR